MFKIIIYIIIIKSHQHFNYFRLEVKDTENCREIIKLLDNGGLRMVEPSSPPSYNKKFSQKRHNLRVSMHIIIFPVIFIRIKYSEITENRSFSNTNMEKKMKLLIESFKI